MTSGAGRRRLIRAEGESGANLVEFALVVPLLMLFLFGIVQFGIAYDKQQSINSAAREGARLGALESTTLEEIATRAVGSYGASAASGEDPTVEVYDDSDPEAAPPPAAVGVRNPDGSYSVAEGDSTLMPCGRDPDDVDPDVDPSEFVRVVVSTPYEITIPFWGVHEVIIDSEAQFRCE